MEFFRDILPLVGKFLAEKERINRVVENSKPIIEAFDKVKSDLLPDLRELVRVFAPGVLGAMEAPRRQAKRPARKRKRK